MEECEVKFLDIEPDILQEKLKTIGAKKIGDYFQRWKTYDYPDWRLDNVGAWLRLRDEGDGRVTLTYKQRQGMRSHDGLQNDQGMEEVETVVSDFSQTAEILEKIGLIVKHYAEKKRIHWEKDGVSFDFDLYPGLKPYLEIEAGSWELVEKAIEQLGLNAAEQKRFSASQVYALNGIDISKLSRISFDDGLIERKD
jgi:adenylate cyclase, class 2